MPDLRIHAGALLLILILSTPAFSEEGLLLKGGVSMSDSENAAAESEYDKKMSAIDAAEDGLEKAHQSKIRAIEEQDSDVKDLQIRDEKRKYEQQKKDLERKRSLVKKNFPRAGRETGPGTAGWTDQSIPGRMMKLAAKMDRVTTDIQNNAMTAGNKFFRKMSDSIGRSAAFMAQEPGTVLPQVVDAVVTYLTNDHNENDQKLYDDAVKAVEEIQKDPASFFGEHAVDIALSGVGAARDVAKVRAAGAAAELAAAEKAGMNRLQQMRRKQAQKLEEAGQTLEGMAEEAGAFKGFGGKFGGGPDFSKIFGEGPPGAKGPINIARGGNNCFNVALAAAKRWMTGKPYVALNTNPHESLFDPVTGKIDFADVGVGYDHIYKVLKKKFGGGAAKNPFHGGLKGLKSHQEGWPVQSSQKKIESAMRVSGDKSQGLVFVDAGEGTAGHVFNVRNNNGKIEFWDFQAEPPVQYMSFYDGRVVMRRYGKMVAVPLPWKRVFFYRTD
jgi:hypothetical protein